MYTMQCRRGPPLHLRSTRAKRPTFCSSAQPCSVCCNLCCHPSASSLRAFASRPRRARSAAASACSSASLASSCDSCKCGQEQGTVRGKGSATSMQGQADRKAIPGSPFAINQPTAALLGAHRCPEHVHLLARRAPYLGSFQEAAGRFLLGDVFQLGLREDPGPRGATVKKQQMLRRKLQYSPRSHWLASPLPHPDPSTCSCFTAWLSSSALLRNPSASRTSCFARCSTEAPPPPPLPVSAACTARNWASATTTLASASLACNRKFSTGKPQVSL